MSTSIRNHKAGLYAGRTGFAIALIGVIVLVLGPYIVMLLTSLTPRAELAGAGANLIPSVFTIASYEELLSTTPFMSYLGNSLTVAAIAVPITLIVSTGAALSLSRFDFPGRGAVMIGLLLAQMFPAVL